MPAGFYRAAALNIEEAHLEFHRTDNSRCGARWTMRNPHPRHDTTNGLGRINRGLNRRIGLKRVSGRL